MLRFIDLGKQIGADDDWPREFAIWDTVVDRFLEFSGNQVWNNRNDILDDMLAAETDSKYMRRIEELLPEWVPDWKEAKCSPEA